MFNIVNTTTGNTTRSLLSMQVLYIDPVPQTIKLYLHLSLNHVVMFLCIYLVLDSNPMGYFLFNIKAKKISILYRQIYITTFPFAM